LNVEVLRGVIVFGGQVAVEARVRVGSHGARRVLVSTRAFDDKFQLVFGLFNQGPKRRQIRKDLKM